MHIEAVSMGGEQDVAIGLRSFDEICETIERISTGIAGALKRAKARKASVEFGFR